MSRKPYIVQQDSPNLVIVPNDTVTSHQESSEKVKLVSDLPTPTQNYAASVFAKKYAKSNSNSVNNNVLIDVSRVQKPPTSWATNYLESIGGSSTKFTRIYSAMPKSPSIRKNVQPGNNTETKLAKTTQIPHQTKTNIETRSIMEEKKPKININLKNKSNSAPQSTLAKEASQTNSNTKSKSYQSKIDTSTSQEKVRKEPSLPKNYKIPMYSKNKPLISPVMDKETRLSITKETCQKSQPSSTKRNDDINELKQSKLKIRETISTKSASTKVDKDPNRTKHESIKAIQPVSNQEKTNENQFNTEKIKIRPSNQNHIIKQKYGELVIPPQTSKETVQLIRNKENSQPKYNKEIEQCKVTNETTQLKKYNSCPSKGSKEYTCLKTNENVAPLMSAEEMYASKINKKQEPTFCSKLKTKKDHVQVKSNKISKTSKHSENKLSQKSKLKNHKDKTLKAKKESNLPVISLEKENIVTKLKKKRTAEKESAEKAEHTVSKSKKLKTADVNTTKKEKSRNVNEERLSKSISPIKSVVSKIKSNAPSRNSEKRYQKESGYYQSHFEKIACTEFDYHCKNSQKSFHKDSNVDLRAKLKRKLPINENKRDSSKKNNNFASVANGNPFVPEENLIISFDTKDDDDENVTMKKSSEKKLTRKKSSGGNKRKKIKLEINIVFGQADTSDDESMKSNDDGKDENMDLSFLDDFNVDEIVKSLNECKDCSEKVNKIEPVSVPDATIQNTISSETRETETKLIREDTVLLNKNEIKVENEVCKEIFLIENKTKIQGPAIQSTVSEQRPCHYEEGPGRIADISKIKEEVETKTRTELLQNEKSQETNCMASSEELEINSSLTITHQKTNGPSIDISQEDSILKINDDKHSTTSLNVEQVKKTLTNTDTALVPKLELSEETGIVAGIKEIKPQIAHLDTPVASSMRVNIIHPDHKDQDSLLQGNSKFIMNINSTESRDINTQEVKKHLTTNEMPPTITQPSNQKEAKATVSASSQKMTETPTCINKELDIIIIEDSDGENEIEIKNNQPVKDNNTKDLHLSKDSPLDSSDNVIIIEPTNVENSESVLILGTDYKIDDDKKCQLNIKYKKDVSESETQNLAEQKEEQKLDTIETVNPQKTEDNAIEIKTNTTAEVQSESENKSTQRQENIETKSEITKTEKQHDKDIKDELSINNKVAYSPNSLSPKPSSKTKETHTVAPEKYKSNKAAGNTKHQNDNTQLETKSPNKNIPQENYGNKDKVTKNNDNGDRDLLPYDHFVEKAESKLFFFLGRKCTITDVIRFGNYSTIYLCEDSLKRVFALKALKDQSECFRTSPKEQFLKEKMLMKLQNGVPENNLNCVLLLQSFVICGLRCFLMEFYPKNLQHVFNENRRSFHIDDVQILSRQLVSAVTILRNNNIVHSDIKPSHILINAAQTRIKLCGFDQSCYIEDSNFLPNTGTVNYRAPELILGYPAGYGIDVWSTGLVMYEMATKRKLFPGFYNNFVLYQQLCKLGRIPMDMLMASKFRSKHFMGTAFTRILDHTGKRVIINEFKCNDKIDRVLFQTYGAEWSHERNHAVRPRDKAKLSAFLKLLKSMLVMHPRYRIAIEFVFANPFIYESLDSGY